MQTLDFLAEQINAKDMSKALIAKLTNISLKEVLADVEAGKDTKNICRAVEMKFYEMMNISMAVNISYTLKEIYATPIGQSLWKYFSEWEHYSGDPFYPVPGSSKDKSRDFARKSFTLAYPHKGGLGFWAGEYGSLRKDLLLFLIKSTEA